MELHLSQSSQQINLNGRNWAARCSCAWENAFSEADSLLGYTDGILRDLKDAEMAIREINSTWHDTARGWPTTRHLPRPNRV